MKRTGIKRGKPLRRTPFRSKPKDPARVKAKHDLNFGELAAYVHTLACCVCGDRGEVQSTYTQAAHVHSIGAGYHAWLDNGDGNILPMCGAHHSLQHLQGWSSVFDGGIEAAELRARSVGESFFVV